MPRVACWLGAAALCLLPAMTQAQQNYYRPLHLQDMVKVFKPVGDYVAVETRHADGRIVSVVLTADLSTVAAVPGRVTATSFDTSSNVLRVSTRVGDATQTMTCRPATADTRTPWRCTDSARLIPAT